MSTQCVCAEGPIRLPDTGSIQARSPHGARTLRTPSTWNYVGVGGWGKEALALLSATFRLSQKWLPLGQSFFSSSSKNPSVIMIYTSKLVP